MLKELACLSQDTVWVSLSSPSILPATPIIFQIQATWKCKINSLVQPIGTILWRTPVPRSIFDFYLFHAEFAFKS